MNKQKQSIDVKSILDKTGQVIDLLQDMSLPEMILVMQEAIRMMSFQEAYKEGTIKETATPETVKDELAKYGVKLN